ncbi:acetyl-CoA carboxylase carboxyltransferase subunit alpha [Seleniivibrio woodruffii]|uniref:Acetyl-coenzyme A carboxylase carboxyl transferase subunit alpha n=1 Tax=Seleniivibrio woodruffii TaxID=1078050 RepID=A0A4R1K9I5_9BACT|nr:acetyl-CoA carboxylase carboxyltransferase subunit alpha [Seleniivibrio woodruffii]TCK60523.1 acetyl-CoA carboxylase carboxyltransferase subunit alpha [Seleniivibrio woodruffii]TVZ36151.1 acetyl-CoA carboxylase carboxyltransferase subunit alpha [Seleniivibrio woodruffii]
MATVLDFEAPIVEIEAQLDELRNLPGLNGDQMNKEIASLEDKLAKVRANIYKRLTPQQKVMVARHPDRPYTLDYIQNIFTDFTELHGDRQFRDDPALICGMAKLNGEPVMVIGHQKGRNTKENIHRNFGMVNPEGYRKSQRLFEMADRFKRPVITFVDTPGAYPGIGAEERGQAEAIAKSLMVMAEIKVPMITVIAGEGGSGGALAIAMGNRVGMLEHSVYAVISPEGCASILWKDASYAGRAAEALKLTSKDLKELNIIDEIIEEPMGGAHRNHPATAVKVKDFIVRNLEELKKMTPEQLFEDRYQKFRNMGVFAE